MAGGMGTGVQELPVMARNENPVEECIEAQEEQTNAESGKEDAADDPDFREGDESEDEDWDESDGST